MNATETIKSLLVSTAGWTHRLAEHTEENHWKTIPEPLKTNVNWLIGHILVSKHYTIECITNSLPELKLTLPYSHYRAFYGRGTAPADDLEQKPGKNTLLTDLKIIDSLALNQLKRLTGSDWSASALKDHPLFKTKGEALQFSVQHQMYHTGQLALVRRLLQPVKVK